MRIVSKDADGECMLWGGMTLMEFEGRDVLVIVLQNRAALNLVLNTAATFSLVRDLPSIEGLVRIAHFCCTQH